MITLLKNATLTRILTWLDNHILLILASFLLAFIPLWPKIPIFSPIEQYIVRVRFEDVIILLAGIIWGTQVLRRKIEWRSPMFWGVLAYATIGFISTLVAIFVIKTVPLQTLHVGKTLLHYFRYLEYFSLFFIVSSAIKTRKQAMMAIAIVCLTVFAVSAYGYGQKYFYWPVYSTMNREFSKGVRLFLTPHARVQSTFGGHYDMAAYMVVLLPLILALAYAVPQKKLSLGLHTTFFMGMWLLILSAARAPFAAFIVGVGLVLLVSAIIKKSWWDRAIFLISRGLLLALLIGTQYYYFGDDMTERLNQVVQSNPTLKTSVAWIHDTRKMIISDEFVNTYIPTPERLQAMLPKGSAPAVGISTDDVAAAAAAASEAQIAALPVGSKSDVPPILLKPSATPTPKPVQLPGGVYENIPDYVEVIAPPAPDATPGSKPVIIKVKKQREWSKCALEKELSLCIRLEVLWPQALAGFEKNMLTGTGYATLTKGSVYQFTEADSTDNNFLRTLGEIGGLGFIAFYGCVGLVLWYAVRTILLSEDTLQRAMAIGMLGGTIGLLLNAVYIDVFAASKVAQSYWAVSGLFLAFIALPPATSDVKPTLLKKKKHKVTA